MLKKAKYILYLIVIIILASCNMSVEDLLVAPSLTADQSGILEAIEQAHSERTSLKYPVSGDWRNPIQFFNGREGLQAVVFYTVAPEVNAHVAVLSKESGNWTITSEMLGDGPEVNSVKVLPGSGVNLLVEWGSVNPNNKRFAVYNISSQEIKVGFKEECSDIIIEDFNNDGLIDFCYITAEKPNEKFKIVYVKSSNNGYVTSAEINLSNEMATLLKLQYDICNLGRWYIYVDESIEGSMNATEIFVLDDENLKAVELDKEYDIYSLSMRQTPLVCRSFFNLRNKVIAFPSETAPRETIKDESMWKYWYLVKDDMLSFGFATYVNIPLNLNFSVPDSWLENVTIIEDEKDQRLFDVIISDTNDILFEIKVLRVEEDQQHYLDDGFKNIDTNMGGIYRYLYRSGEHCIQWEERFILYHFYGCTN